MSRQSAPAESCSPGLWRASLSLKKRGTTPGRRDTSVWGRRRKMGSRSRMGILAKISTATDERSARLAGISLMLLSIFMFSFGDALGKFMVATYSVGQLLWLRACAALLVLLPLIWRHRVAFLHLERPCLQLLRVTLST